jgi:uncharacterized protein YndB with AHSA1/START domain
LLTYDSLSVSEVIPARPERIYAAWLSSEEHTAFTGDRAVVEPFVGGAHSTFDGYSSGRTVDLQPGRRIVQTWRAEDFPAGSPDSRVEVTLEETVGGTMLTILHTDIPSGQGSQYRDGWLKFYLEPLKRYFVADAKPAVNGVRKHPPRAAHATAVVSATKKRITKKRITKKRATKTKTKARVKAKAPKTPMTKTKTPKRAKKPKKPKKARPKVTKPKRRTRR